MKKIVKFGGSSLADGSQFKKVHDIIVDDQTRQYVVPSAPGKRFKEDIKVTDLLYQAYEHVEMKDFESIFKQIEQRYYDIQNELDIKIDLKVEFDEIKANFKNKMGKEYAASRGEYLSGKLLAAYLGFTFIDAKDVIFIDENGNYDETKTDPILSQKLKENQYVVIPGFYGASSLDPTKVKTFSRGGSDITGSIVAKCGECDLYENWTDVSGFLMADPRIVKDPAPIEMITYKELRELSYMGASVLHENSIFPIRKMGIPIQIKNTNRPQDQGTMIVESTCHQPKHIITGISGMKDFSTIQIEKEMMNSEIGFARKVLQVLEDQHISLEHMPTGIDTMTLVVSMNGFIEKEQEVLAGLHKAVRPDSIELNSSVALIAVVGREMKDGHGVAAKVFKALSDHKINVVMMDQGSSQLNIIIGVKNKHFEQAIQAIYDAFIF